MGASTLRPPLSTSGSAQRFGLVRKGRAPTCQRGCTKACGGTSPREWSQRRQWRRRSPCQWVLQHQRQQCTRPLPLQMMLHNGHLMSGGNDGMTKLSGLTCWTCHSQISSPSFIPACHRKWGIINVLRISLNIELASRRCLKLESRFYPWPD